MLDPGPRNRTLAEVLAALHEHFSTTTRLDRRADVFRVGHEAGMRFARICVLDKLTSEAGHTDASVPRRRRDRRREKASLQAIEGRLTDEIIWATKRDPEYDAGYISGVELALRYVALARTNLAMEEAAISCRPVSSPGWVG
ncbi:hypothetical protein [Williamsia sp. 1135]|uniref:hypothetical protein n=1 Tax=Williamsia sp. 1135 TaxID=1889262 RepID=UPI000A115F26|nr:hypothetical protein [Williamsia sp. 1135]ORM38188.1 hypothetical protein BFL43_00815 [Williamsia sp. 1135]